ncbi:MAG: nicotinamide-nucleotide amidase [Sedimenticola sp.]|nr:nicotinamide-nucleotide amidase [Sedimenticola sp.]
MSNALESEACRVANALQSRGLKLTTAESCTGGWIAKVLTDIAGSSVWFDRGFITYSNEAKRDMLAVSGTLLETQGAVSEAVVAAMVQGALAHSRASVAVSVSGIAGPGGGSDEKPVGTVWFGWQRQGGQPVTRCHQFTGDREAVRQQAVVVALEGVLTLLDESGQG